MKRELLLVSGFSRGGTNILWNLICSHPGVLSTGIELNEIYGPSYSGMPMIKKAQIESFAIPGLPVPQFVADYAGPRVISYAEEHARNSWGQWKTQEETYTEKEISQLPVCTKSVNSWSRDWLFSMLKRNLALKYNDLLLRSFGRVRTVYLVRDAESQCNGWMRRGCIPYEAGKWYRKIIEIMLDDYKKRPNDVLFVKFQDVLLNPIEVASQAHAFLGLEKLDLPAYHLKLKKVLKADGKHEVLQGKEGDMVWIPKTELKNFLDPGVDARQREMLDDKSKAELERGLGNIIERLNHVFDGEPNSQILINR